MTDIAYYYLRKVHPDVECIECWIGQWNIDSEESQKMADWFRLLRHTRCMSASDAEMQIWKAGKRVTACLLPYLLNNIFLLHRGYRLTELLVQLDQDSRTGDLCFEILSICQATKMCHLGLGHVVHTLTDPKIDIETVLDIVPDPETYDRFFWSYADR